MIVEKNIIKGLLTITPKVFEDDRGYFFETFNKNTFNKNTGLQIDFVQDNESKSSYGTLRGLHYQLPPYAQAKLVRVLQGEVFDVAVDLREESDSYGQHYGILLSDKNKKQFFIPKGFAHGFVVLSETAVFAYKCDNYYNKEAEGGIIFNDTTLNIDWQIDLSKILLSEKDAILPKFVEHLK